MIKFECIAKIQWFLAHVNYIKQEVAWCKFYHNKDTRETAPLNLNTTEALFYQSQCTNALLFNSATFIKTCNYSQKNIIINSMANKYQQNYKETILSQNFSNFLKT